MSQLQKRLQRRTALDNKTARKLETRHKIELGGLVVKADLGNLTKAQILGILIDAKNKLEENPKLIAHYTAIGSLEFAQL